MINWAYGEVFLLTIELNNILYFILSIDMLIFFNELDLFLMLNKEFDCYCYFYYDAFFTNFTNLFFTISFYYDNFLFIKLFINLFLVCDYKLVWYFNELLYFYKLILFYYLISYFILLNKILFFIFPLFIF